MLRQMLSMIPRVEPVSTIKPMTMMTTEMTQQKASKPTTMSPLAIISTVKARLHESTVAVKPDWSRLSSVSMSGYPGKYWNAFLTPGARARLHS